MRDKRRNSVNKVCIWIINCHPENKFKIGRYLVLFYSLFSLIFSVNFSENCVGEKQKRTQKITHHPLTLKVIYHHIEFISANQQYHRYLIFFKKKLISWEILGTAPHFSQLISREKHEQRRHKGLRRNFSCIVVSDFSGCLRPKVYGLGIGIFPGNNCHVKISKIFESLLGITFNNPPPVVQFQIKKKILNFHIGKEQKTNAEK